MKDLKILESWFFRYHILKSMEAINKIYIQQQIILMLIHYQNLTPILIQTY